MQEFNGEPVADAFREDLADEIIRRLQDFAACSRGEAYARAAAAAMDVPATPQLVADLTEIVNAYEAGCPSYLVAQGILDFLWPPRSS